MLLPKKYATTEEGNMKCRYCGTSFAIPEEEKAQYTTDACEDCQDKFDKDVAAATAALMKNPTDAADAIQKALGK